MKSHTPTTLAALLALFALGCTSHIAPYHSKRRAFDVGEYADQSASSGASIFATSQRGLFEDDRARNVGDIVVIQVDETDAATHDATTKMGKKSDWNIGVSGSLVEMLAKAVPAAGLANLLGTNSGSNFDGTGTVKRGGRMTAMLPVRVRKVLPNRDLYVEGTKVVMVGHEEHHLYISGVVRQVDIRADGSISSGRVADAEIEYTGRGDVTDYQRPGWLTRMLNKVQPF